jgi:hypothetical protein
MMLDATVVKKPVLRPKMVVASPVLLKCILKRLKRAAASPASMPDVSGGWH